jgi:hypothetical protein
MIITFKINNGENMKKNILILLLSIFLFSCGGYNSGIIVKDSKGYLKFMGNTDGISVSIDDAPAFKLERDVELYELNPGNYNIKVYRDDIVVVNRTIIVDQQTTYEIEVP